MIPGIMAGQMRGAAAQGGLPSSVGEAFGGGYYVGDVTIADGGASDGTYAVIMAGAEAEATRTAANPRVKAAGTDSATDGLGNSLALQAANPANYEAAIYSLNYSAGGYDDWYLPAPAELSLAWTNRGVLGGMAMGTIFYWTSRQDSSGLLTYSQSFADGTILQNRSDLSYGVRPTRRLLKNP